MEAALFYIFSALAIVGAIAVVSSKSPITSVLSLVLTLFSTAVLFIMLLAQFIAVVQILIYAGAIMVLFLFVVMFLNLRESGLEFDVNHGLTRYSILFLLVLLTGFISHYIFTAALGTSPQLAIPPEGFGTVQGVSTLLFNKYILPFELTSVLILVAILGVVVIAKRRIKGVER